MLLLLLLLFFTFSPSHTDDVNEWKEKIQNLNEKCTSLEKWNMELMNEMEKTKEDNQKEKDVLVQTHQNELLEQEIYRNNLELKFNETIKIIMNEKELLENNMKEQMTKRTKELDMVQMESTQNILRVKEEARIEKERCLKQLEETIASLEKTIEEHEKERLSIRKAVKSSFQRMKQRGQNLFRKRD